MKILVETISGNIEYAVEWGEGSVLVLLELSIMAGQTGQVQFYSNGWYVSLDSKRIISISYSKDFMDLVDKVKANDRAIKAEALKPVIVHHPRD